MASVLSCVGGLFSVEMMRLYTLSVDWFLSGCFTGFVIGLVAMLQIVSEVSGADIPFDVMLYVLFLAVGAFVFIASGIWHLGKVKAEIQKGK